jgi:hypothetical protein
MRENSSGDLIVVYSGSPTGPFPGPEDQDPFWSTGVFRRDLFGVGSSVEVSASPAFPETSAPDTVPSTAAYFPGTEAPRADHTLILSSEMAHSTDTMSVHTGITTVSQAPIGTPLSPKVTPTLPPGYRALNASIPIPTQIPSGTTGGPSSSGHSPPGFILTLPHSLFGGPSSSSTGNTNPSSTIPSFTPNYQIPGGQFHQGGSTHPPFVGKIPIGMQNGTPQLEHNPRLEDNHHPTDKIYLYPWPSIGTICYRILNRLGGNSFQLHPLYPLA